MTRSLSNLVNNLSGGLHNYQCRNCKSGLDYISNKDNQLIFKYIECSRNHKNHFNKDLIKKELEIRMNFVIEILINLFCY